MLISTILRIIAEWAAAPGSGLFLLLFKTAGVELLALITISGLVAGSYVYAEASLFLKRTVEGWGDLGKLELPVVAGVSTGAFVAVFSVFLSGALFVLDRIQR